MNLSKIKTEHRKRILNIINKIPYGVPNDWDTSLDIAVGGLMYVGFSEVKTEKLICISSQKQSVIDCKTGDIVFEKENYDENNLIAISRNLENEIIYITGIGGGGLRHYNKNGDVLDIISPYYPEQQIVFMPRFNSWTISPNKCNIIFNDYEIKSFGFSKCGNYIVVATSSNLKILRKS